MTATTSTATQAAAGAPTPCGEASSAAAPHWEPEQGQTTGLYGPRGWTVNAGVWDLLANFRDSIRTRTIPLR